MGPTVLAIHGRRRGSTSVVRRGLTILTTLFLVPTLLALVELPTASVAGASTVTQPTVSLNVANPGASATYTIDFATSGTGAVAANGDLTIVAPAGTLFPGSGCDYSLVDVTSSSGSFGTCGASIRLAEPGLQVFNFLSSAGAAVSIIVPNAINAGDQLQLTVTGVVNPDVGSHTLTVATSADTTPSVSHSYSIGSATSTTVPTVSMSSNSSGATSVAYQVSFTTSPTGAIPSGGTINLLAPPGTLWPNGGCNYSLTDATTPSAGFSTCSTSVQTSDPGLPIYGFEAAAGAMVSVAVPNPIGGGDSLTLTIDGVANPGPGSGSLAVSTSSDTIPKSSSSYTIGLANNVTGVSASLSSSAGGATGVTYTVGLTTSAHGAIPAGGYISLVAPDGTQFPSGRCSYTLDDLTTASGDFGCSGNPPAISLTNNGSTVTMVLPNAVLAGDSLSLEIDGVTNPGAGTDSLAVATSADPAPRVSNTYAVSGLPSSLTSVTAPSVAVSTAAGRATGVTSTVTFTATTALTGGSLVNLTAPPGTVFGSCPYGCGGGNATYTFTDLTNSSGSGAGGPAAIGEGNSSVSVSVPNTIAAGDTVALAITQMTNPPAGAGTFSISTSTDEATVSVGDSFDDPGSVTSASVLPTSTAAQATNVSYTVTFTAGSDGQLAGGLGAVNLVAPPGTLFGGCPYGCGGGNATYTFVDMTHPSGSGSGGPVSINDNGSAVSVIDPNAIQAGDVVVLTITQVTNPPTESGQMSVSTTSNPVPVSASDPITAPAGVGSPQISLSSPVAGVTGANYTIQFTTSGTGGLIAGQSTINLIGGPGTSFNTLTGATITDLTDSAGSGTVGGSHIVGDGSVLSLVVASNISPGDTIKLTLSGLTNPTSIGTGSITVSTSTDTSPSYLPFSVVAPEAVTAVSASVSPSVAGATASLTTFFTVSPVGGLVAGQSSLTLAAPAGMVFPAALDQYRILDVATGTSLLAASSGDATLTNGGATATIPMPLNASDNDQMVATVTGVTNPGTDGSYQVSVSTSSDSVPTAASFTITPGATLSGQTTESSEPVQGAAIEACPTSGGACGTTSTNGSGDYSLILADGTYQVTAALTGLSPATTSVTVTGTSSVTANLQLSPLAALPAGTTLTAPGRGSQSDDPFFLTSQTVTISTTGCPNGFGDEVIVGTNSYSGQIEDQLFPLTESPVGSGDYTATIPPLSPIHGYLQIGSAITCPPSSALFPNGGGTVGGTAVTINGSGFTGATAVDFGSTPAESFTVVNDTTIDATSPPGSGVVDVQVTTPSGQTPITSVDQFTYDSVDNVSPGSGPQGTPVTVTGTGFTGATSVFFGSQAALTFTVDSDTQITATAPPGAGTVDVEVIAPIRTTSLTSADQYTYAAQVGNVRLEAAPPAAAVSLKPSQPSAVRPSGSDESPAGSDPRMAPQSRSNGGLGGGDFGGTFRTIICEKFFKGFPGCNGPPSPPPGGPGTGGDGGSDAGIVAAIQCLHFVLASGGVDPCFPIPSGSGPAYVDPSGSVIDTHGDPVSGATVTVLSSSEAAGPYSAVPSGSSDIQPSTNPETSDNNGQFGWEVVAGYYEIEASKPGCHAVGQPSQPDASTGVLAVPPPRTGLTITLDCGPSSPPVPTVSSVSPAYGPTTGGSTVTITGTGLNGATAVSFGTEAATDVSVLSPTTVEANVPARTSAGQIAVTVKTPGGTSATNSGAEYTYLATPAVSKVSPKKGGGSGGTMVTIKGTFADVDSVNFGSTAAPSFTVVSSTELTAVSPPGTGKQAITVSTICPSGTAIPADCGTSPSKSSLSFAYGKPATAKLKKTTRIANGYVDKVTAKVFPPGDTVTAEECDASVNSAADLTTNCDTATLISGKASSSGTVAFSPTGVTVKVGSSYVESGTGTVVAGGDANIVVNDSANSIFVVIPITLAS